MSTFHYDMRSKEIEQARKASHLASQVSNLKNNNRNALGLSVNACAICDRFVSFTKQQGYQSEFVGQQTWSSSSVTSQEIVRMSQAQKTISDVS